MNWATAIVIIVAIAMIAKVLSARYRAQAGTRDYRGGEQPIEHEDAEAKREIEELRERIKVLERIATESNSVDAAETRRISEEIERLRDRRG